MNITTQSIIKSLPLETEFKLQFLENFEKYTPDQKFRVEQLVWDTFDAFYEMRLQDNIDIAMEKAKENNEVLDEMFFSKIREKTQEEVLKGMGEDVDETSLAEVRKAMEQIVKEIQASKK